jgi:UDPglucose 6-dehydrogenase
MLAQRISSINAISAICEETGADITEISHAVGLDPRIGPKFLKAGLGFGGSCFRKDIASLTYLAQSLGLHEVAEYWQQVNMMNKLQRRRFASKIIRLLDENLIGKKIALLGFAFKNGTGDTRESLAVDVVSQLLEERPREIAIFDPCCKEEDIRREVVPVLEADKASYTHVRVCQDVYTACAQADAILIITDCDEFKTDGKMCFPGQPSLGSSHAEGGREVVLPNGLSFALTPMTECSNGCAECGARSSHYAASSMRIDWAKIARNMKEPRWVFDGRCILDVEVMDKLGFRVESIGRQTG